MRQPLVTCLSPPPRASTSWTCLAATTSSCSSTRRATEPSLSPLSVPCYFMALDKSRSAAAAPRVLYHPVLYRQSFFAPSHITFFNGRFIVVSDYVRM
eukprot:scaffold28754_cov58-Phaeocystis_antarctica.AAC.2